MFGDSATRRFQVFVSSTYLDLVDERQAVMSALLQLKAIPAGMELFPAADDDAWRLICRVIDDCDYYLLVLGGKYGSIDQEQSISFTEKEYDYAVAQSKPVMAFLHADLDKLTGSQLEKTDAARSALEAFRDKVKAAKHVKFWTSAIELKSLVALSYVDFVSHYPATGWVRADRQAADEVIAEVNVLRKRNTELEDDIKRARELPPPGTDDLAQGEDQAKLEPVASRLFPDLSRLRRQVSVTIKITPTWDSLLSVLGARLLDECEESELRKTLDDWIRSRFWDSSVDLVISEAAKRQGLDPQSGLSARTIQLSGEDFDNVIIQLLALGLIERSQRKRSVSDRLTYWTLTQYGQTRAIRLRAVRRSDA